jgi:lycopene cyclase domain-containing protein
MSYSAIAILAVIASAVLDLVVIKSDLLKKKVFWTSYAIILPFQLLTNWWLTSRNIVMYSSDAIFGLRIAAAPVEDLLFGFSLLLGVLSMWIYWGRKGLN